MPTHAARLALPTRTHRLGASALTQAIVAAVVGWPFALWSAWRARRRLRAYGPPAVIELRPHRSRQN